MGKGGKQWGAGRPGWHVKSGDCRSIDVRYWHRAGVMVPGSAGEWVWRDRDGRQVACVAYSVTADAVVLRSVGGRNSAMPTGSASTLDAPATGSASRQEVPILRTPCTFGGDRLWFGCPHCARRVAVLFQRPAMGFACRHCAQVVYTSQSEDAMARAWRQQGKLERLLGVGMTRPKGMHHATHGWLVAKVAGCEGRRLAALVAWLPSAANRPSAAGRMKCMPKCQPVV
jgi:hypothetical protein